jgi:hypothetical protein
MDYIRQTNAQKSSPSVNPEGTEKLVEERNANRINSYIKNNDFEGLKIVKRSNLETYGDEQGMNIQQALDRYGSYKDIINASIRSNLGMVACTGLYDICYGGGQ